MREEKNWVPGHIEKAKRLIMENLKAVQAVVEITDARAPYSGRAYEWKKMFHNKKNVLVLSKSDLADAKETKRWIEYYEGTGVPCFALNLKDNPALVYNKFIAKITEVSKAQNFQRYMIVGIPNVGKSTLVNGILGKRKARVGNTPGVTRGVQWIYVSDDLLLMDTPGILYRRLFSEFVKYKLILCGCLKPSEQEVYETLEYVLPWLGSTYPSIFEKQFNRNPVDDFEFERFINEIGQKRGYLQKGGVVDRTRVLTYLIAAFQNGDFGRITYETLELLQAETLP